MAVHEEAPLVIVDPRRPPQALRLAESEGEGEMSDGEGRH
jgi:hypothetical protein